MMKPHRATLILVFGILGLVSCPGFGIAAWFMGNNDLREMDAGLMDPSGRQNTSAGRICGIISAVLLGLGLLVALGAFVIMAIATGVAASAPH